ncbi:hypothetical protein JTE90_024875 [Oedothorax gibbosus]|uniref:Sushi domain-containing protein n=1 Tax=Oedothorax gibbosus TaxID=931172 RepID=A0AAV6V4C8_9ARAC|nr:hypothetical protein JTE90_024875 [Oedothorax gibbosus]
MAKYIQVVVFLQLLSEILGGINLLNTTSISNLEPSNKDEKALMYCNCHKIHKPVKKKIAMTLAEEIFMLEAYSYLNRTNTPNYTPEVLKMLQKCHSCKISYTKCFGDPNDFDDYFCHKNSAYIGGNRRVLAVRFNSTDFSKTVRLTNKSLKVYPKEIDVPQGKLHHHHHHHHHHHRIRRQLQGCAYPTSLESSALKCKIYPKKVKCVQQCALGFTLKNGTEVMRVCNKTENVWKPGSFEECRPYIDCSLTLMSGGSKNCSTPTTTQNVWCDVRCEAYEDKRAASERRYTCDVNGKWSPHLPFCVQAGSGLDLVPKPHKTHKKESDHYYYVDNI